MNDGEDTFWRWRRLLGVRDYDEAPQVDAVIREELELYSLAKGEASLERVRRRLQL